MDKGIVFSIIIAAIVSITAAVFWDEIVKTPKVEDEKESDKKFEKTILPNKNTVQFDLLDVIDTPYNNKKPKKSEKPERQPKPTATNPVRNANNTENLGNTELSNVNQSNVKTHIVRGGESLSKISKIYYKTEKHWPFLQKYNHLRDDKLDIGQKLLIPAKPEN
ncbi:MAG: LysM peptidoglycan-binding domain-containing protein [Planctomycetes bacterium]|nr:LysM peptidoglycan-binding domain-containing protein [Planctomycetota bacterium]